MKEGEQEEIRISVDFENFLNKWERSKYLGYRVDARVGRVKEKERQENWGECQRRLLLIKIRGF